MNTDLPRGLQFSFADLYHEIECIKHIANGFLESSSLGVVLPRLKKDLENIQFGESQGGRWGISRGSPLTTKTSYGSYARGHEGELNIFATMSFVWEVARVPIRKGIPTHFSLDGLASTCFTLFNATAKKDLEKGQALAAWNLDVGSHNSPGIHFHVQLHHAFQAPELPKTLDVPRLPAFAMTPLLALEALLADLFQDDWASEAVRGDQQHQTWNKIQRRRLKAFFEWQQMILAQRSAGSPWIILKQVKPEPGALLGDE